MLSDRSFGARQGPFGGNTPVLVKGVMNQDVHESKMQQGVFCRVGSRCGIGVKYQEHFLPEHVIQTLTIRSMETVMVLGDCTHGHYCIYLLVSSSHHYGSSRVETLVNRV